RLNNIRHAKKMLGLQVARSNDNLYDEVSERVRPSPATSQSPLDDHRFGVFATPLSAIAAGRIKTLRRGAGNANARPLLLARGTAQTSHSPAGARPGRVERFGVYPWLRRKGICGGLQCDLPESAELWRDGAAHFHALSFRTQRRFSRGGDGTDRARRTAGDFRGWVLDGRQPGSQNGGGIRGFRAGATSRRRGDQ